MHALPIYMTSNTIILQSDITIRYSERFLIWRFGKFGIDHQINEALLCKILNTLQ